MEKQRKGQVQQHLPELSKYSENEQKRSNLPAVLPSNSPSDGIKEGSNLAGGGIPIPSGEAFARRYLRIWTRRLMIFCLVLILCCVAALPLLSRLRVKRVIVEGCAHYNTQYLTEQSGVSVGDELLLCEPGDIQAGLIARCPYLRSVSVERKLTGDLYISVTERRPCFALTISPHEVALLDETMQVLEVCPSDDYDRSLSAVQMELFPGADGQAIEAGKRYAGNASALEKLTLLFEALSDYPEISIHSFDLINLYAVSLTLTDGTVFALHDLSSPEKQLRTAVGALGAYRQKTGETAPVMVDVDEFCNVFVGALAPNGE